MITKGLITLLLGVFLAIVSSRTYEIKFHLRGCPKPLKAALFIGFSTLVLLAFFHGAVPFLMAFL
jgi:hypothetical protein